MKKCLKMIVLLLLMIPVHGNVYADSVLAPPDARIVFFHSDVMTVTPDEAESGTFPITLTWKAYLRTGDSLTLQTYVLNAWHHVKTLEAHGELRHTVPHTLTFAPPMFRLVLKDRSGLVLETRTLHIPYQVSPQGTTIEQFEVDTHNVTQASLQAGNTQVPVHWKVTGRPPNANIVFEQVTPDGQAFSAEFPRDVAWLRSEGSGTLRLTDVGNEPLQLRMSVMDVSLGTVYAEQIVDIPRPQSSNNTQGVPESNPPSSQQEQPRSILSFTSSAYASDPGETVTLSWTTRNADRVWIAERLFIPSPGGSGTVQIVRLFDHLPGSGSLEVTLPDTQESSVTYQLALSDPQMGAPDVSTALTVELNTTISITTQLAFQSFEKGYMVWRADTGTVYVFYGAQGGPLATYPLSSYASLADNTDEAPDGYYSPINAFGRVWKHYVSNIGWATAPENGYSGTIEQAGSSLSIPFPNGNIAHILNSFWGF